MRHLHPTQAAGALRRGMQVEQFLGRTVEGDTAVIRWLTAAGSEGRYVLSAHAVIDIGTEDFRDISEFPPVDDDEYVGEGTDVATAATAEELLTAAVACGAAEDRWVNQGLAAADYVDSLA